MALTDTVPERGAASPPGAMAFALLYTLHSFAQAITITLIPLEALRILESPRDVSLLFFAVSWATFAGRFAIPLLIQRFRRRRVITAGYLLMTAAPMLLGAGGLPFLAAGMAVRIFGSACGYITLNLYIMDYVKKEDLARVEPLKYGMSGLAWTAGPTLGVLLFEGVHPYAAFGLASAFGIATVSYFWYLRVTDDPAVAPARQPLPNPFRFVRRFFQQRRLRLAWLLGVGRETWWNLLLVYGPVYVVTAGAGELVAGYLTSAGMATMMISFLAGWLARRHGLRPVMGVGFVVGGLATLAVLADYDAWMWGAACLLAAGLGINACDAVGNVLFFRMVRKRERPEMTMVYSTYGEIAGLLFTGVFSVLLSVFDLWVAFAVTGAAMFGFAALTRSIPRGL